MRKTLIRALAIGGFAATAHAADIDLSNIKIPDSLSWAGVTIYGAIDVGAGDTLSLSGTDSISNVTIDDGTGADAGGTIDITGTTTFSNVTLAVGPNSFVVRASDAAGNVSGTWNSCPCIGRHSISVVSVEWCWSICHQVRCRARNSHVRARTTALGRCKGGAWAPSAAP